MRLPPIRSIDLNADLGEHDGGGYMADEALLRVVSSASIACGAHAGGRAVIEETARRAAGHGVTVGAHPSYPDREGFGRRDLPVPLENLMMSVKEQIETAIDCCARGGATVAYVKPHGALYNRAMKDAALADAITECVSGFGPLAILSLPESELARATLQAGLPAAREAFIDRAYSDDGMLVPRSRERAVIHDIDQATARAVRIATTSTVETIDGGIIAIEADSLCVHSDSPNALDIVGSARLGLMQAGIDIRPFA